MPTFAAFPLTPETDGGYDEAAVHPAKASGREAAQHKRDPDRPAHSPGGYETPTALLLLLIKVFAYDFPTQNTFTFWLPGRVPPPRPCRS